MKEIEGGGGGGGGEVNAWGTGIAKKCEGRSRDVHILSRNVL